MTTAQKKKVRTYSANDTEIAMLEAVAQYHGFSKSAAITNLVKREFWRIYPAGTDKIRPTRFARVNPDSAREKPEDRRPENGMLINEDESS